MFKRFAPLALVAAGFLALGGPVWATTPAPTASGVPPVYSTGGVNPQQQQAIGVSIIGRENGTGAECLVGSDVTCQVPGFGGGGGGGGGTGATGVTLMTADTPAAPQTLALGGPYFEDISGTLGGATLTITSVSAAGVTTSQNFTSLPGATCVNTGFGTVVSASLAGGSPSAMNVRLEGTGPCPGGGGGGGGAIFGPTAVASAVANPPIMNGYQDTSGNVAIVTPTTGLPVSIVSGGGSGGTSSNFAATYPTAGTAFGVKIGSLMQPWLAGSATSANSQPVVIASDQAAVAMKAAASAFASGSILSGACATGCIADLATDFGTASLVKSNASSGVAASANNLGVAGYLYGYNGTTWDQLQVDGSKNLKVLDGAPGIAVSTTGACASSATAGCGLASLLQLLINSTAGGVATPGSALVTNSLQMCGSDGTNCRTIKTDAAGNLLGTCDDSVAKRILVANNTTSIAVSTSPGRVCGIGAYGIHATAPAWVKLYNAAQGSTTCGSGTPVDDVMIATATTGNGAILPVHEKGFGTAITACITGLMADADATAPAASSYYVSVYYTPL